MKKKKSRPLLERGYLKKKMIEASSKQQDICKELYKTVSKDVDSLNNVLWLPQGCGYFLDFFIILQRRGYFNFGRAFFREESVF